MSLSRRYDDAYNRFNTIAFRLSDRVWCAYHKDLLAAVCDKCVDLIQRYGLNAECLDQELVAARDISHQWRRDGIAMFVVLCVPGLQIYSNKRDPEVVELLSRWADMPVVERYGREIDGIIDKARAEFQCISPIVSDFGRLRRLVEHAQPLKLLFPNITFDRFKAPVPRPDPFPDIGNLIGVLTSVAAMNIPVPR